MTIQKQPAVIFSVRLRALCAERGLRQTDLSAQFRVSQAAVSKWFNGSVPSPDILPNLAEYLGVSVDYLLSESTERAPGIAPGSSSSSNLHESEGHATYTAARPVRKNRNFEAVKKQIATMESELLRLKKMIQDVEGEP